MIRKDFFVGLLFVCTAAPAFAQSTPTSLGSFNGTGGALGYSGLIVSGNTLYGTTFYGGNGYSPGNEYSGDGVVFSVPLTGGTPTVLASFDGNDGANPNGDLILSGNTLYGTTYQGGANGVGTIFSVPLTGGTPTALASFDGTDGAKPPAGLTLSGNTLYGTTKQGGANDLGTVFSVPITGGTPNVLASFNGPDGYYPDAGLTLSGSMLYGTTEFGGANGLGLGNVFSLPITGGTPTVLALFNGANGQYPRAGLTLSGNTLYGTANQGGANGAGTVFSVPITGGTPTVLASFNDISTNGAYPAAGLALLGNTLYGTTEDGGAYSGNGYTDGTVFSIPLAGGTPTILASFNDTNGKYPAADLALSGNVLYGTTEGGGADEDGVVFAVGVPEPVSASLIYLAGLGLLARRRRTLERN